MKIARPLHHVLYICKFHFRLNCPRLTHEIQFQVQCQLTLVNLLRRPTFRWQREVRLLNWRVKKTLIIYICNRKDVSFFIEDKQSPLNEWHCAVSCSGTVLMHRCASVPSKASSSTLWLLLVPYFNCRLRDIVRKCHRKTPTRIWMSS